MARAKLTVQEVAPDGAFLRLSDGRRYLIAIEQHSVAARLTPGATVHVTDVDYPVNGCEIRADTNLSEAIRAIAAR